MNARERAAAWIRERGLSDAPWAGESHVTSLAELLQRTDDQRVAWELAAGKASFLRGEPDPIASAGAAFTYAYRTEEQLRKLEHALAMVSQ